MFVGYNRFTIPKEFISVLGVLLFPDLWQDKLRIRTRKIFIGTCARRSSSGLANVRGFGSAIDLYGGSNAL